MSTSGFDYNVANYKIDELMKIIDVTSIKKEEVIEKTDALIHKFQVSKPKLAEFFTEVREKLIDVIEPQSKPANLQLRQPVSLGKASQTPIIQNDIGVRDSYPVSIKQDVLNPNLKNTITRFVNLDSQFRSYTSGIESSSSEYTLDLSDMLRDVLSIRLYSYQIPFSWYSIKDENNCFWLLSSSNVLYTIKITPGNYTPDEIVSILNKQLGLILDPSNHVFTSYNNNNGKLTLDLSGCKIKTTGLDISKVIFYDIDDKYNTYQRSYMNITLGWMLGFRVAELNITTTFVGEANAIIDLNGTKYLVLAIDDFNQNHVNNTLVSITQVASDLKMPSYYSTDLPTYISNQVNEVSLSETNGLLVAGKYNTKNVRNANVIYNSNFFNDSSGNRPLITRSLTQSQIYTINEINKNRSRNTNYLLKAPTNADILAVIPIKTSGVSTGKMLVDVTGPLQDNLRTYFGPVNIDRMCVRLLDDKGNVLNMNGSDWCVTLICECLYQY